MLAHKADTEEHHRGLSAASFATWPQLHPRAFISRSTDLLHVSFGCPLLLFPNGVQRMATLGMDVGGISLTCLINLHLLFFTSIEMGSIPVRSWSSTFDILFGQKMCRILPRHLFWNSSSMWYIPLVMLQDSAAYSSTLSTLLLRMCIFTFLVIVFVFMNLILIKLTQVPHTYTCTRTAQLAVCNTIYLLYTVRQ